MVLSQVAPTCRRGANILCSEPVGSVFLSVDPGRSQQMRVVAVELILDRTLVFLVCLVGCFSCWGLVGPLYQRLSGSRGSSPRLSGVGGLPVRSPGPFALAPESSCCRGSPDGGWLVLLLRGPGRETRTWEAPIGICS